MHCIKVLFTCIYKYQCIVGLYIYKYIVTKCYLHVSTSIYVLLVCISTNTLYQGVIYMYLQVSMHCWFVCRNTAGVSACANMLQ